MSKNIGVTPEEQNVMDEGFPQCDDVASIVGIALIEGSKVGMVQLIFPRGAVFAGWPKDIQCMVGAGISGDGKKVALLRFAPEASGATPLLVTPFSDDHRTFIERSSKDGFYVMEVWTERELHRAMIQSGSGRVAVVPTRAVTEEEYQTALGKETLPLSMLESMSKGGTA